MRVNARLDEESQQQIEYLTATTGMAVSQVLRESVALYYRQVRTQRSGMRNLAALIGRGESGRSDIASDVKSNLSSIYAEKHGREPGPIAAKPAKSARRKAG